VRIGLVILLTVALVLVAGSASADRKHEASWARPAVALTLLDGWRSASSRVDLGSPTTRTAETCEPGEALTVVVERMWSQVRAYRRPGGAELIVRGRF
jgi:hypothetical protein